MILADQIKDLEQRSGALERCLNIEQKRIDLLNEEEKTQVPDFWDNPDAAQKTAQAVTQLKEEVGIVHNLEQRLDDLEVMVELALEEPESGMEEELEAGLEAAKAEIEHLELGMLLNGEYDANNAILTLHAGAGGTEAQDWTSMLLRMFTRYAERQALPLKCWTICPVMKQV